MPDKNDTGRDQPSGLFERSGFMGSKNNWLLRVMVLAAAGMFTFAAVNLAGIYLEYRKGQTPMTGCRNM